MSLKIGFMQGRLCDRVDGKIQAFPWKDWVSEFHIAQTLNFRLMEWTLDQEDLYKNPLMTSVGQKQIRKLSVRYGLSILSLTADCFMQFPFYKARGVERKMLLRDLSAILDASQKVGIRFLVLPLVDNGSLRTQEEESALIEGILPFRKWLIQAGMKVIFESDFDPKRLATFINHFPCDAFGINYDIGNSAAAGFSHEMEIDTYGFRIDNVHVKDRKLHGVTVPLGTGNADFPAVFRALREVCYRGCFILQTARAEDNDHAGAIARYRDMTHAWWQQSES
jgi:hexulose-6-phosphate isomerase